MTTFPTPNDESGNVLIEIVCPAEFLPLIVGVLYEHAQSNDFGAVGDVSPAAAAAMMETILSLMSHSNLPGGFPTDINGAVLTDIYGRLIYGGV